MPTDEELENYKRPDGTIDWGKYATDQLSNQSSVINNQRKKPKELEDLQIYKTANELSDSIWDIVSKWDYFAKKTIGDQWVRATDSITANITEGYGRYFFGEYIVFLYYARGSLYEANFWLEKAKKRLLINDYLYRGLKEKFDKLPVEINKVVKVVRTQAYKWKGKPRY